MAGFVADTSDPAKALKELKTAIGVWSYLNDDDVKTSFVQIFQQVKEAFVAIDDQCAETHNIIINLEDAWDKWFRDMLEFQAQRSYDWIESNINRMISVWLAMPSTNKQKFLILGHLASLTQGLKAHVHYDTSIF